MNATPTSARRIRHSLSPRRVLLGLGLGLGSAAVFVPTAHATNEFPPNPSISVLNDCVNEQYHYWIGLYNLDSIGGTTFTVSVTGATPATAVSQVGTHDHFVGPVSVAQPKPQQWLEYVVAEGTTASFHIVDTDAPGVDFLAEPKADCVPEPVGEVTLVCPTDGSSAFVHYEYKNNSYASTHFDLGLNGASVGGGDYAWSNAGAHTQDAAVAEDSHVTANITAHGGVIAALDTTVDCVPAIPDTTVPETTVPETTVPDTTPETVPVTTIPVTTIPVTTIPVTTIPATTVPVTTIPDSTVPTSSTTPAIAIPVDDESNTPTVQQSPVPVPTVAVLPQDVQLPTTGSDSSGVVAAAFGLLIGGLGVVRFARRAR